MSISSRTPEGLPQRCPVCGRADLIEPSLPGGDACCPSCGHLLWWFRDRLSIAAGIDPEHITLSSLLADDLRLDSLAIVELFMELEEELDVDISDEEAEHIQTVEDLIRFIERRRRGDEN